MRRESDARASRDNRYAALRDPGREACPGCAARWGPDEGALRGQVGAGLRRRGAILRVSRCDGLSRGGLQGLKDFL